MHFVIFTLLFAGACLAQSDPAGSLVAIVPAFKGAAGGLQSIGANANELASRFEQSEDASEEFYSFAKVLSGSNPIWQQYAKTNVDLSNSLNGITDEAITNADQLDFPGVNSSVNSLKDAEYAVSSIFDDTTKGIGESSGFSADLSDAVDDIESVVTAMKDLIETVNQMEGVRGIAFGAVVNASHFNNDLENSADGIKQLTTAMEVRIDEAQGNDFNSVIDSLDHLAKVQNDLVEAIKNLPDAES